MKRDPEQSVYEQGNVRGSETTRAALIETALILFGEKGFAATSTRDIAAGAKANIGSIAYHFGSKEGLHRACGQAIAARVTTAAGLDGDKDKLPETPAEARAVMIALFRRLGSFMLASQAASTFVPFMLREMAHPGAAFEAVYDGLLTPVHRRLCRLYASATGTEPETDLTKIAVFAIIGEIMYFRIASSAVARRLGKPAYESPDIAAILSTIEQNIIARLDAGKAGHA